VRWRRQVSQAVVGDPDVIRCGRVARKGGKSSIAWYKRDGLRAAAGSDLVNGAHYLSAYEIFFDVLRVSPDSASLRKWFYVCGTDAPT